VGSIAKNRGGSGDVERQEELALAQAGLAALVDAAGGAVKVAEVEDQHDHREAAAGGGGQGHLERWRSREVRRCSLT
jgi:hypothetical protein